MTKTPSFTKPAENVAPVLKGAGLIAFLADWQGLGLLAYDAERNLAMVGKRLLTEHCHKKDEEAGTWNGGTPAARATRAWLQEQGFRGSRRSRSYYLTLRDLKARGVDVVDGVAVECTPVEEAATSTKAEGNFAATLSQYG